MICENCGKTVDYDLKFVIRITGIEPVEASLCRECVGSRWVRVSYYHLITKRLIHENKELTMDEKTKKYVELLEELQATLENAKNIEEGDIDVQIGQTMRECRQMVERLRRLKDGDGLTYEPVKQEEPKI